MQLLSEEELIQIYSDDEDLSMMKLIDNLLVPKLRTFIILKGQKDIDWIYTYDFNLNIFVKMPYSIGLLKSHVGRFFDKCNDNANIRILKNLKKFKTITKGSLSHEVYSHLTANLTRNKPIVDDIFDNYHDYIHFKNGKYNLQTGLLENRVYEDYCTECLPYDYKKSSKEDIKYIENILNQIYRHEDAKEYVKYVIGSSLSGHCIDEQIFLVHFESEQKSRVL
jgi:hypothetical protein